MGTSASKFARSALTVALLAAAVLVTPRAFAGQGDGACRDGVLATDAAGDGTYAGQSGTGADSTSGDIVAVRTDLRAVPGQSRGPVAIVTDVVDLVPSEPQHFDLELTLDLTTESGDPITVVARRSAITGETASVNDSADGVSVAFDEDADQIHVSVPRSVFAGVRAVSLSAAETRYDSGAVLSPLADQASGGCVLRLDPSYKVPTASLTNRDVTILAIDTGVNGHHPEFADGQIVAWWDFSAFGEDQEPGIRTWFDTDGDGALQGDRDDPYDPDGHGSAVASVAVGANLDPTKTSSQCPGCRLAFAKVYDEDADSLNGSIADAIRWGVDVVGVDVVTVSISAVAPVPTALLADTYEAITYARDHGVLVLFANGNGWGNAGVPGQPGGFMNYANSTDALAVGADGTDSFLVTTDPEVVAVFSVHAAAPEGDGYQDISGTSFSTPFTAGVAARIIGEGRFCRTPYDLAPDSLEDLIKRVAIDRPEVPPSFEGYGVITRRSLDTAYRVVCLGEEPPVFDEVNDFYVTNVSGTQRSLSSDTARTGGFGGMSRTGFTEQSPEGSLTASSPAGPADAEIYTTVVAPGARLEVAAAGTGPLVDAQDFDMVLYAGVSEAYEPVAELDSSGEAGAVEEKLAWLNTTGAPLEVSVIVYGWAVGASQPFTLTSSQPLALDYDGYLLVNNL